MNIVNLTPHMLNVRRTDGTWLDVPPSGQVARVSENRTHVQVQGFDGIAVTVATYGQVENLPDPQDGVIFIVSALVLQRVPHRRDVFAPGTLIRNDAGQPVGCDGLSGTPALLD